MIAILFGLSPRVHADPIHATYNTIGSIGTTESVGPPNVSFQGVSNGSLVNGQPFSVGQFIVTPPPAGATTAYNAPFQVTLTVTSATGDPALPGLTPVTLGGIIQTNYDGGQSVLRAGWDFTGDPIIGEPSYLAKIHYLSEGVTIVYGLYPTSSLVTLVPTNQNGGVFDLQAELDAYNAPEPTPLALFVAAGVFLLVRRYLGATKRSRSKRPAC